MRIFEPEADEEESTSAAQGTVWVASEPPSRARTAGIWVLTLVDLALAAACVGAFLFLGQAHSYLLGESAEFGSELDAANLGLWILRIACVVLAVGFVLAAIGVVSMSRLGWRLQRLWAVLMCLTIAGLPYGIAALVLLHRHREAVGD